MIIRSYACLNRRCRTEFESWADTPSCPACKQFRIRWVPKQVNTAAIAPKADRDFRDLAETFNLSDIASAREGERAKPKLVASKQYEGPKTTLAPAPGFSAQIPTAALANGAAMCVPLGSMGKVSAKAGAMVPVSTELTARMRASTKIEASHKG